MLGFLSQKIRLYRRDKATVKSPKKRWLVVLFAILLSLSQVSSTSALVINSASKANNLDWQIRSILYYEAISGCFSTHWISGTTLVSDTGQYIYDNLTYEQAINGQWFSTDVTGSTGSTTVGSSMTVGAYMVQGGDMRACDSNLVDSALKHWGLNKIDVLCSVGFTRTSDEIYANDAYNQCANVNNQNDFNYLTVKETVAAGETFRSLIQDSVYGYNNITFDTVFADDLTKSAAYYWLYLNSVNNTCIPGISETPPNTTVESFSDTGDNTSNYNGVSWVDVEKDENNNVIQASKINGVYSKDQFTVDYGYTRGSEIYPMNRDNGALTCAVMVQEMSNHADDYATWVNQNKESASETEQSVDEATSTVYEDGPTCNSEVKGIGWIVCPTTEALAGITDKAWNVVQEWLKINPISQQGEIYDAWLTIRNIANVLFVIFFIIIIFSQLTSIGIDNYGIKKLLPKIIISIILVNASFIIIQLLVDVFNIIGSGIYNILAYSENTITWSDLSVAISGLGAAGGVTLLVTGAIIGPGSLFLLMLPAVLMAFVSVLAAFFTLLFRQSVIPILAILAPVAFVAYLLPNTSQWFTKWRDLLLKMLMLYPMAAIVFGGAQFASSVILGENPDVIQQIQGLVVLMLPLFSLPFLARQGGAILNAVNGGLTKLGEKLRQPVTSFSKERADISKSKWQAGLDKNGNKKPKVNRYQRIGMRVAKNRQTREANLQAYRDKAKDNWNDEAANDPSSKAGQAYLKSKAYSPSDTELESQYESLKTGKAERGGSLDQALNRIGVTQDQLVDSNNKQQAYNSRLNIAKDIQTQNYAESIDTNLELRKTAAGVGGQVGEARVQAAAQTALDEAVTKNVNAAKVLLKSQNYNKDKLSSMIKEGKLVQGFELDANGEIKLDKNRQPTPIYGADASEEQLEAAFSMIMENGEFNAIEDAINSIPKFTKGDKNLQQRLSRIIATSPNRPKYFGGSDIDTLSAGDFKSTVKDLMIATIAKNKMSANAFAQMDADEMQQWNKLFKSPEGIEELLKENPIIKSKKSEAEKQGAIQEVLQSFRNNLDYALADERLKANFGGNKTTPLNAILEITQKYSSSNGNNSSRGNSSKIITPGTSEYDQAQQDLRNNS